MKCLCFVKMVAISILHQLIKADFIEDRKALTHCLVFNCVSVISHTANSGFQTGVYSLLNSFNKILKFVLSTLYIHSQDPKQFG